MPAPADIITRLARLADEGGLQLADPEGLLGIAGCGSDDAYRELVAALVDAGCGDREARKLADNVSWHMTMIAFKLADIGIALSNLDQAVTEIRQRTEGGTNGGD